MTDRQQHRPAKAAVTLESHIDLRDNALNLMRLVLASSVIVWHSFTVTGHPLANTHFGQLLGDMPVDGFFAISGFLLCASWFRKPKLGSFARNRVLRLLPAYWTSLLLTALIAAPVSLALQSRDAGAAFTGPHSALHYLISNAALQVNFYDVSSTPLEVPYPSVWNGSAWTLIWEAYAYIGLAAVAFVGLLRRRGVMVFVALVAWGFMTATDYELIRRNFYIARGSRLGFMFLCGVLLYLYRDRISGRRRVVAGAGILLLASVALKDYRVLGAIAVAYLVIWIGGAIRNPRWQLKRVDISYGMYIYAFPIQQILVLVGLGSLPPLVFAVVAAAAIAPVATASWFVIERPALRLKAARLPNLGRGRSRQVVVVPAHQSGDT